MRVWGITGTNGKTTVTWILAEFLQQGPHKRGDPLLIRFLRLLHADTSARIASTAAFMSGCRKR